MRASVYPELLAHMLSQVNYADPEKVAEVPNLLAMWTPPSPTGALALFDAKFADERVHAYAVDLVEAFREHELRLYLLQLVQALKYQLYDDSPLAQFLLRKGLAEPKFFGHQLFWQLMSEAHLSHIRQRFSRLLVHFVYGMGAYRDEMIKGYTFTKQLVELNHQMCGCEYSQATGLFRQALAKVEIPTEFHLPMDPRLVVDSFIIEKCKVMNSKKRPFWLAFHNSSPFATGPVLTLFKVGDDLRQDQLTLQVLKVMEYLWRQKGHEFHMRCYGVLPTGFEQGFIEVVPRAVTESELQKERGTISGVWATDIITQYLQKHSPSPPGFALAREIFRLSSAAYAIATSVLGVADRHPGNIMVQQDGHYFHIDFGHFLGNWKEKYGVKREGDVFHFSPACAEAIGHEELPNFEQNTRTALAILRENANLLITLFLLMVGTGIPELKTPQDIDWLKQHLYLKSTEAQANAALSKLIKDSMESTRTKLNNLVHNIKV
jgi:phosphatidylinositol-4,5-bisphosphate 3-kinase